MDLTSLSSDSIFNKDIFLFQKKDGYRFTTDALLLSWYIFKNININSNLQTLEIGSGSGVIPITLFKRGFNGFIDSFEVQPDLYEILSLNIKNNSLENKIRPLNENFLESYIKTTSIDVVFTNPPYFTLNSCRVNSNSEKALARHEINGSLSDFFKKSSKILKFKGSFFLVYPLKRVQYALMESYKYGLFLKNITFSREYEHSKPSVFLAHFVKGVSSNIISTSDVVTLKKNSNEYSNIGKEIMYDML